MKRSVLFCCVVISILMLTGCGTKELSCTMEQSQYGTTISQTINATFKGAKVTYITLDMDVKLDSSVVEMKEEMADQLSEQFKDYQGKEGLDFNIDSSADEKIVITMKADLKKMSSDDKNSLDLMDTTGSYSATKAEMEKEGYTCK